MRIFKRASTSEFIGRSNIKTKVSHWEWTKGRGLYAVFIDGVRWKSEYTSPELLSGAPEGKIVEILKTPLGKKLFAIRQKAIAGGMMLKSEDEILSDL